MVRGTIFFTILLAVPLRGGTEDEGKGLLLASSHRPHSHKSPSNGSTSMATRRRQAHLELLDGLERLRAVGQRLLQVLPVSDTKFLQSGEHGARKRRESGPPSGGPPEHGGVRQYAFPPETAPSTQCVPLGSEDNHSNKIVQIQIILTPSLPDKHMEGDSGGLQPQELDV